MRKFKISLRGRMIIYFLSFAAIMIGILWLMQTLFLEDFYKSIKLRRIDKAMSEIVSAIETETEDLEGYVDSVSRYYDICTIVLDERFGVVASEDAIPGCTLHELSAIDLQQLYSRAVYEGGSYTERWRDKKDLFVFYFDNQIGVVEREQDTQSELFESIITTRVVVDSSGNQRIVYVNSILTPVSETVYALNHQLIYSSLAFLLIAILLAVVFSKRVSTPITNITTSAETLGKGEYTERFENNSGLLEIDKLGDTLNFAASELSKVEGLRRELIANVSHDLRTPLTLIAGYAEVMRDVPGENTPETAEIIISEVKRMSALVSDTMDISKIYSGNYELNFSVFSITDSVTTAINNLSHLTEYSGYAITFEDDREILVEADEIKINQVIYNLLINAVHYTGEDKTVKVIQSVEDGFVKIEVIDSGKGISEQDLPHIFERYYKSSEPKKKKASGSGLGLSIVKGILDLHKAAFGVITSKSGGSNFWFRLKISSVESFDSDQP